VEGLEQPPWSVGCAIVPELTNAQLSTLLVVIAGLALASLLFALVALRRLAQARRELVVLRGDAGEQDILAAVGSAAADVDALRRRVDSLAAGHEEQVALGRFAVQRFALVRYDAFPDMGGRLSYSVALLDEHGDGFVLTSINGRTESRTYAKPIKNLTSQHNLSEEEQAAIADAAAGTGRGPATAVRQGANR